MSLLSFSYLALYAYKPQKTDELELRKGEMYRVTEKCQDGWFKGTSLRNGMSGVFPGNYVTPVSRVPTGAGQPRNLVGGSPTAKGSLGAVHPGGPALTNSTTIVRPPVPITTPPTAPQLPTASPQMNSCSRYSSQPTVIQARGSAQMGMYIPWYVYSFGPDPVSQRHKESFCLCRLPKGIFCLQLST
uniref:E3 ubiquitin-protein ligase sh3rf3 n=1 Tax=Sphaerodactylus townsendi TaxID=933632 RepID=A0ACB8FJ25_9SAUR